MKMPIPRALVTRYFQLIVNRQFTEAERQLERLKLKIQKTDWNKGYFRALSGMHLARKNNGDAYAFFSRLQFSDKTTLLALRREFLEHVNNKFHGDFDRGYFSALAEGMRVFARVDAPRPKNTVKAKTEKERTETAKSGKDQTTIQNFLRKEKD